MCACVCVCVGGGESNLSSLCCQITSLLLPSSPVSIRICTSTMLAGDKDKGRVSDWRSESGFS